MKTKHVIFGVLYAIMFISFSSVGNGWAVFLTFLLLLCDISGISLRKDFDKAKLDFEKTLFRRKKAFDEMFEINMQLMEDIRAIRVELKQKDAEIAELKPLAKQRLDYLQHERDRKKTFRAEKLIKKYVKENLGKEVNYSFGNGEKYFLAGYRERNDGSFGLIIGEHGTSGWSNDGNSLGISKREIILKEYTTYHYIAMNHETKN